MNKNTELNAAKAAKKDEFYTQLSDIEEQLKHYTEHFRGKAVYSNCDDWRKSQFVKYFKDHFHELGLKKYIATCYGRKDLFAHGEALWYEYDGTEEQHGELEGDGDFRSLECAAYLKQCDIIVTNPPFSLFREFVEILKAYRKGFLIIGHLNAVTYKEVFPMIKDNKMWMGPSIYGGEREFGTPKDYPLMAVGWRIDEQGRKFIRVKGVRWFTNLNYAKCHEPLILCRNYTPEAYPHYDNYDAIEVGHTKDIPMDYDGVMGVPITFLDKWCPEQFEVVDADGWGVCPSFRLNGRQTYRRILIRRKG